MSKQQLGQFYTNNADYILEGFEDLVKGKNVVDPFSGEGDLLRWAKGAKSRKGYDIDDTYCEYNDYWEDPVECEFVLTNPPYLARNKAEDKAPFEKYKVNDLFRAFLVSIECQEGIVIVPINFLSATRDLSARKRFLSKYTITRMKLFHEQVFDDTTSTVIAFHFKRGAHSGKFLMRIMPEDEERMVELNPKYDYRYGNDYFKILETPAKVSRLLEGQPEPNSRILLHALDGGSANNRIRLELVDKPYYGKQSDRSKAHIVFRHDIPLEKQKEIVENFNSLLESLREKYDSLFLSNYRESSSLYARKRIGFSDAYKIISYLEL